MFNRNVKPLLFVFVLLALLIILFQIFKKNNDTQITKSADNVGVVTVSSASFHTAVADAGSVSIDKKVQLAHSSASSKVFQSAASKPIKNDKFPEPWKVSGADVPYPTMPLPVKVSQYEIVKVDTAMIKAPTVGEKISLPILNGQNVVVNVESNQLLPNGDSSWSGHLDGHGNDYPIVVTYGPDSAFATITTPQGSYSMESVGGSGWLYKNPSEVELTAPGVDDQIYPDSNQK